VTGPCLAKLHFPDCGFTAISQSLAAEKTNLFFSAQQVIFVSCEAI
jgi:hypothetical protein